MHLFANLHATWGYQWLGCSFSPNYIARHQMIFYCRDGQQQRLLDSLQYYAIACPAVPPHLDVWELRYEVLPCPVLCLQTENTKKSTIILKSTGGLRNWCVCFWSQELTKKLRGDTQSICIGDIFPPATSQHVCGGIDITTMIFTENPVWTSLPGESAGLGQQWNERVATENAFYWYTSNVCKTLHNNLNVLVLLLYCFDRHHANDYNKSNLYILIWCFCLLPYPARWDRDQPRTQARWPAGRTSARAPWPAGEHGSCPQTLTSCRTVGAPWQAHRGQPWRSQRCCQVGRSLSELKPLGLVRQNNHGGAAIFLLDSKPLFKRNWW